MRGGESVKSQRELERERPVASFVDLQRLLCVAGGWVISVTILTMQTPSTFDLSLQELTSHYSFLSWLALRIL